jgi:RimJ/RimL family protein N-acetyltransferase
MLIGKTISLKPVTPDDAQLVAEWFSDPAYLGEFYNISPRTRQMIEPWMADAHGPEKGRYLITRREQQDPVGTVGFWNPFTPPPRSSRGSRSGTSSIRTSAARASPRKPRAC